MTIFASDYDATDSVFTISAGNQFVLNITLVNSSSEGGIDAPTPFASSDLIDALVNAVWDMTWDATPYAAHSWRTAEVQPPL